MSFEENGEMDRALEAYRKVLNVDPGQSQLASRVAALLIEQDDFPQAIDVLKDAIKANPKDADPYQQLAFIYAKYLKKTDQAIDYANRQLPSIPETSKVTSAWWKSKLRPGKRKRRWKFWIVPQRFAATTPTSGCVWANFTWPFFSSPIHSRSPTN